MEKNNININKKVLTKSKKIEVKGDIIVPDSKPDIVSIINTNANPYIYKENCEDGKYKFDGNILTRITYLSSDMNTECINTTLDFMDFIEDNDINSNMNTKYRIEIMSIDTKILNERKLSVCINLKITVSFFECVNVEYIDNLGDLKGVQKLEESINLNTIVAQNKIKTSLKEDISVDENDEIVDILKTDITVQNYQNKISYNKVLSKADVNIKILYITENGAVKKLDTSIPIMNFIDMENVTDEEICIINYKVRNMNFRVNSSEIKSVNCQIDFEVSCEVYQQKNIVLVQDMYGINKNIIFNQKEIEVPIEGNNLSQIVNINENILVEDIRSIYDVTTRANVLNRTLSGTTSNIEGELILDIYFDTGNKLSVQNVKIPFMAKIEGDNDDIEVGIKSEHFKLNNEDVVCDVELEIRSNSSNYKKIKLIDDIQEEPYQANNEYAMIVYFVKQGDTVWNIARDFRITTDSLMETNNLDENDKLSIGKKLYIVK